MTALFIFDNATTHQKQSPDALSARKMVKNPKLGCSPIPNGPKMRDGQFANGEVQHFHFPENHPTMPGWFKGSEQILKE